MTMKRKTNRTIILPALPLLAVAGAALAVALLVGLLHAGMDMALAVGIVATALTILLLAVIVFLLIGKLAKTTEFTAAFAQQVTQVLVMENQWKQAHCGRLLEVAFRETVTLDAQGGIRREEAAPPEAAAFGEEAPDHHGVPS